MNQNSNVNTSYILSAVLPILTLGIGVLIGQFVKWNFEKKRLRYQERKQFIKEVRLYIAHANYEKKRFRKSVIYSQLRPHLSKRLIAKIENTTNNVNLIVSGDEVEVENPLQSILNELTALEKKWGLL